MQNKDECASERCESVKRNKYLQTKNRVHRKTTPHAETPEIVIKIAESIRDVDQKLDRLDPLRFCWLAQNLQGNPFTACES